MTVRGVVAFIGLLLVTVGIAEIAFPEWSLTLTESLIVPLSLRLAGILSIAIGMVLLHAAFRRIVGLRLFVEILGLYTVAAGAFVFLAPGLVRDFIYSIFLHRSHHIQMLVLWLSGSLRIALGLALLYAVARSPRPEVPR